MNKSKIFEREPGGTEGLNRPCDNYHDHLIFIFIFWLRSGNYHHATTNLQKKWPIKVTMSQPI